MRKGNKSEDIHTVSLCVGSGNESEFTGGKKSEDITGYKSEDVQSACVSGLERILYM